MNLHDEGLQLDRISNRRSPAFQSQITRLATLTTSAVYTTRGMAVAQ